jgi:putative acetyltransferase
MISVREESPEGEDINAIGVVNERAFARVAEAMIVDKLRHACSEYVSLVATEGNQVIGHILFTPVTVHYEHGFIRGMGLAPMAVFPEYQRQGIGTALVARGLEILHDRACPFVVVLGHPDYYPRFGFEPASRYRIRSQWDGIPDEAFMIRVLDRSSIPNVPGVAKYRDEFNEAM